MSTINTTHSETDTKYTGFIPSINCVNCQEKITKALDGLVADVDVNIATKKITYLTNNNEAVLKRLVDINYPVEDTTEKDNSKKELYTIIIGSIAAIYFLVKMILLHFIKLDIPILEYDFVDLIIATIVQIVLGKKYLKSAWSDLKYHAFGMNFLVALSTSIAYIYSVYLMIVQSDEMLFFEIQVILLTVIYFGQYIEEKIKHKANANINELLEFDVKQILTKVNDKFILKDLEFIRPNEVIQIKTGDKIPLDGKIIKGATKVNESLLTGEEALISKTIDDDVISGSINTEQTIEVLVTKDYQHSYLNTLVNQIDDVTKNKPKVQQIGDKIIQIFVPIIVALSFLTFIYWYSTTGDVSIAIYVGLSTLIIACPCALGLATPISFMIGNSKFNQKQLLVRSMDKLLHADKINTIAFDKTGTIIDKSIIEYKTYQQIDSDFLNTVKTIEMSSTHPLANMIVTYLADYKEINLTGSVTENKGIGLAYQDYEIGSYKILNADDQTIIQDKANIFVTYNSKLALEFLLDYQIRPEAPAALKKLHENFEIVMITGDQEGNAQNVAGELDFDRVYSEVLPDEKIAIIKDLQAQGKKVMYVGDGINDTLALAQADLSLAINGDVEAVKQISDVIIVNNNLSNITDIFRISTKIRNNVYQNYLWAFSYNIIAIPLAMSGLLNPAIAGLMMMLSSILVVSNANRLLKI